MRRGRIIARIERALVSVLAVVGLLVCGVLGTSALFPDNDETPDSSYICGVDLGDGVARASDPGDDNIDVWHARRPPRIHILVRRTGSRRYAIARVAASASVARTAVPRLAPEEQDAGEHVDAIAESRAERAIHAPRGPPLEIRSA